MIGQTVSHYRILEKLGTDYIDVFQLFWVGRTSALTSSTIDAIVELRQSGMVRAIGVSIHDRKRAGKLADDSPLDMLMIRYNAAHTGAEQDIFPYLVKRNPAIVAYTATRWRALLKRPKGWDGPVMSATDCYRFCLHNPNVDIVDYRIDDRYMDLSLYLKVEGDMLAGEPGGGRHVDTAYIFIDTNSGQGFEVDEFKLNNIDMKADYMIEIKGYKGVIHHKTLFRYDSTDMGSWKLIPNANILAATDMHRLEAQIDLTELSKLLSVELDILANAQIFFQMTDWSDGLDIGVELPVFENDNDINMADNIK